MPDKKNRCWRGYESVKGKKPNSQRSCRPKAESKLTDSEKKFRAKRQKQLDEWQDEHPHTRRSAAQHLSAPSSTSKKSRSKSTASKSTTKRKRTPAANKKSHLA
jgi:hypothetical protein